MKTIEVTDRTYKALHTVSEKTEIPIEEVIVSGVAELIKQSNLKLARAAREEFADTLDDYTLQPSGFEEENAIFGPPNGLTENEVFSLCAAKLKWCGMGLGICSCWKISQKQMEKVNKDGIIWITTLGGQPPILPMVEKPWVIYNDVELIK